MKEVNLAEVGVIRLNSYKPLCINDFGKRAITKYNFQPFIDASCRREPDFENPFPSISALCRKGKFAPQLKEKDVVVYISVQSGFQADETVERHSKLVAILQVIKTFANHKSAADWYLQNNLPLPSNCMVEGNLPLPFDRTAAAIFFKGKKDVREFLAKQNEQQKTLGERRIKIWDEDYKQRAETWQQFVVTKPIFLELRNPPVILRNDFIEIFKRVPNTQTPNRISRAELTLLAEIANLKLTIG